MKGVERAGEGEKAPPDWEQTNPGTKRGQQHRDLMGVILDGIYELESKFAGGGMGEIWKARHIKLDTEWLVKLLPAEFSQDSSYIDALLREAKLTANLPGGHFPSVVHTGISDGVAFYVMEDIPGQDLKRLLVDKYKRGMSAAEALPLLEQILEAMSVAHSEGVIHRDIKPDNIFVETVQGKDARIRILDFGVAKVKNEVYATIASKLPRGTQQYMPPELHKPIPDPATAAGDVFAIGLTAYQMILGRHPFASSNYVQIYEQGKELGELYEDREGKRAGVNADVSQVLSTSVRFNPEERFADAGEMLKALKHATEFRPSSIAVGTVLNNSYRVLGKLGKGAQGAVYDVEDIHRKIEEKQVLKILTYPPGCTEERMNVYRERFRRECGTLHELQHEAIPYIYGNESHLNFPFLVMERAKGETFGKSFHRLLAKGGWEAVFNMAAQIASALDAVHKKGIVHRDIKPSNIVVDPETAKTVVLDFGIARLEDTQLTAANLRIGTPGFSAPEQLAGAPVPASDQWSFAACFYALLLNIRPGGRPGEEKLEPDYLVRLIDDRVMEKMVTPFSEGRTVVPVPGSVTAAIEKAMSYDIEMRFGSVSDFVKAMKEGVEHPDEPVTEAIPVQVNTELNEWISGGESTVLLLTASSEKAEPILLTQPVAETVVDPKGPEPTTLLTERAKSGKRKYAPVAGLICTLLVGVGYAKWQGEGRGGREGEIANKHVDLAQAPSSMFAISSKVVEKEVVNANAAVAEPPLVTVSVFASYNGKKIGNLKIRIGNEIQRTPFAVQLAPGETALLVEDEKYRKEYTCLVASNSECEVKLVRRNVKRRKSKTDKRPKKTDMIHIFKDQKH